MFVLSVYQDCRGYIWAGTYSGLSILDGNGSKVAFTDRPEVKAAAGAMVLGIGGSQDGCVWINTNFGIDCWNIDTGRYEHHPRFSGNYQMSVGPKGQVVILTRNKEFYAYNVRRHRFQPITTEPVDVRDIHAMEIDSTGCWRMITGTHTSEYQLSEKDDGHITATLIRRTIHEVGPLVSAKADNGSLLMINAQGILYQGDLSGRHARMICQLSPKMMQSQPYSAILKDGEDYLIGLYARGIYRLKRTVQGYAEEPTPLTSGIFGIIRDTRQNILWVATDGEGLRYLTHEPYEIHTEPYSRLSFPVSAPIRAILQDSDGNLWAGTEAAQQDFAKAQETDSWAPGHTYYGHKDLSQIDHITRYIPCTGFAPEQEQIQLTQGGQQDIALTFTPTDAVRQYVDRTIRTTNNRVATAERIRGDHIRVTAIGPGSCRLLLHHPEAGERAVTVNVIPDENYVEHHVDSLLRLMTLDEKLKLIGGTSWYKWPAPTT